LNCPRILILSYERLRRLPRLERNALRPATGPALRKLEDRADQWKNGGTKLAVPLGQHDVLGPRWEAFGRYQATRNQVFFFPFLATQRWHLGIHLGYAMFAGADANSSAVQPVNMNIAAHWLSEGALGRLPDAG